MAKQKVNTAVVPMGNYRERVTAQYRDLEEKKVRFIEAVGSFGALLNEVEQYLGDGRGRGNEGEGLKGWLEENCPEVNYSTAKCYKLMAAKMAKMIGGGVQALACLQGRGTVTAPGTGDVIDVDAAFVEKRDALFAEVQSRRQLEQMWFEFCGGEARRPGRPKGTKADLARRPDVTDEVAAARAVWSRVIVPADRCAHVLSSAARLLNEKDVEDALVVVRTLVDMLTDRQRELKAMR